MLEVKESVLITLYNLSLLRTVVVSFTLYLVKRQIDRMERNPMNMINEPVDDLSPHPRTVITLRNGFSGGKFPAFDGNRLLVPRDTVHPAVESWGVIAESNDRKRRFDGAVNAIRRVVENTKRQLDCASKHEQPMSPVEAGQNSGTL